MTEFPGTLRPGVFTRVSLLPAVGAGGAFGVAVAAPAGDGAPAGAARVEAPEDAAGYGAQSALGRMLAILLAAGVSPVWAVPAGEDWAAAYDACAPLEGVALVLGSGGAPELAAHLESWRENGRERVGILPGENDAEASAIARAHGRADLVVVCDGGVQTGETAAALAAAISLAGPGAGLNGLELPLEGFSGTLSDARVEALLRAGVTPVEAADGRARVVRAVTTGAGPGGPRSLAAALAADDVLRTVRGALRARLRGLKNDPVTRESIASQILIELENKRLAGIIGDYSPPSVRRHPEDPSVCVVTLGFTAAPEISQILLSARIQL